jgi:hypothetical protein
VSVGASWAPFGPWIAAAWLNYHALHGKYRHGSIPVKSFVFRELELARQSPVACGKLRVVWRLLWKRFFLMIVGAWLVLGLFNSGPLVPRDAAEANRMFVVRLVFAALGLWMIVSGARLKPPDPPAN